MRRRRDTDGWTPAALRHVALGESLPGPEQRVKEAETADVEHDDAPRAVVLDVGNRRCQHRSAGGVQLPSQFDNEFVLAADDGGGEVGRIHATPPAVSA
jgi:hypothetical protein